MNRSVKITLIIIAAVIAFLVIFGRLLIRGGEGMGDKVAIIEIKGMITDSEEIIAQIHQHRDNSGVKALVLRIDSPGGSVAPVQEIFGELKKISQPIARKFPLARLIFLRKFPLTRKLTPGIFSSQRTIIWPGSQFFDQGPKKKRKLFSGQG